MNRNERVNFFTICQNVVSKAGGTELGFKLYKLSASSKITDDDTYDLVVKCLNSDSDAVIRFVENLYAAVFPEEPKSVLTDVPNYCHYKGNQVISYVNGVATCCETAMYHGGCPTCKHAKPIRTQPENSKRNPAETFQLGEEDSVVNYINSEFT